jgi:hypothetical protein
MPKAWWSGREALAGVAHMAANFSSDQRQCSIDVVFHQMDRQPQRSDISLGEPHIAARILFATAGNSVNAAVHLDRQLCGMAVEVEDVGTERVLSPEVQTIKSIGA